MSKQRRDIRSQVLGFVEAYVEGHGYPPTYDEIMESVQLSSKSHVDYYLDELEKEGRIERKPRTPRGLRLISPSVGPFKVQVEGYIAAGRPIELAHGLDEEIEITRAMADPRRDVYALRVEGDSMVDALVGDGDLVIVERAQEALRGQMAVVYLRGANEATLKYIYPEGARVRLQPAHPTMPAFHVDAADVEVQGHVVAVLRLAQ